MKVGDRVITSKKVPLKHLRGLKGVIIDDRCQHSDGYWGVYIRSRKDYGACEIWFPEEQLEPDNTPLKIKWKEKPTK